MPNPTFFKKHPVVLTCLQFLPCLGGIVLYWRWPQPGPDAQPRPTWLVLSGGLAFSALLMIRWPAADVVRRWIAIAAAVLLLVDWVAVFVPHPRQQDLACDHSMACETETCPGCTTPVATDQAGSPVLSR